MKKIIIMFLVLITLTGCAKEKGEIQPVEISDPFIVSDIPEEKVSSFSSSPVLEHDTYYDYHAGFSIPYPSDWEVSVRSPNLIVFSDGRSQMTISHFMTLSDSLNYREILNGFKETIENEPITVGGLSATRRPRQFANDMSILSDDPLLISETYDNIKLSTDTAEYISHVYSERRYTLRYNNCYSIISLIAEDVSLLEDLDYMVSEIKSVPVKYSSSVNINGIELPDSFKNPIPSIDGKIFAPSGSDAFADCFVQVYNEDFKINNPNLDSLFLSAFGCKVSGIYNNDADLVFQDKFDVAGIGLCANIEDGDLFGAVRPGMLYIMEIYQLDGRTVIIGYPLAKQELIKKLP